MNIAALKLAGMRMLEDASTATSNIDFTAYKTALTNAITPAQILAILASVVGVGMSFFLMWLGVRKTTHAFTSAVAYGKIRI